MVMTYQFDLFGPTMKPNRESIRAVLFCFFNHGYELEAQWEWGPFNKKSQGKIIDDIDLGEHPLDTLLDVMEFSNENHVCFRMIEDKGDYAWFHFHPEGIEDGNYKIDCGHYSIVTNNFSSSMYRDSETLWKLIKRFQRVLSVLKPLALITKSFYGNAYMEEIKEEHFQKYVIQQKARYPFNLTFWGRDYPTRPDSEAQARLERLGYKVENNEAGTWLYKPVELWYSDEHKIDWARIKEILKFDDDEGYSSIWFRPDEK